MHLYAGLFCDLCGRRIPCRVSLDICSYCRQEAAA